MSLKRSIVITFEDDEDMSTAVPPDVSALTSLSTSQGKLFSNEMKFRKRLEDLRDRFPQWKISGFVHNGDAAGSYHDTEEVGKVAINDFENRSFAAPRPPQTTASMPFRNGRAPQIPTRLARVATYSEDPSIGRVQRYIDAHVAAVPITSRGKLAKESELQWKAETSHDVAVVTRQVDRDVLSVDSREHIGWDGSEESVPQSNSSRSAGEGNMAGLATHLPIFKEQNNAARKPSTRRQQFGDTVTCTSELHIKGEHKSTGNVKGKQPTRVRVGYLVRLSVEPYLGREGIVVTVKDSGTRCQVALYDLEMGARATVPPMPLLPLSLSCNKKWWCGVSELEVVCITLESYVDEFESRRESLLKEMEEAKKFRNRKESIVVVHEDKDMAQKSTASVVSGVSSGAKSHATSHPTFIDDAFPASPTIDIVTPRAGPINTQQPTSMLPSSLTIGGVGPTGSPTLLSSLSQHGGSFHRWMRRLTEFEPIPTDFANTHVDQANDVSDSSPLSPKYPTKIPPNSTSEANNLGVSTNSKSIGSPSVLVEEVNFLRRENAKLRSELTESDERATRLEVLLKNFRAQLVKSRGADELSKSTSSKRRVSVDRDGEPFSNSFHK